MSQQNVSIHHGNNMDVLPTLPDNSIDAVVTDPPYELGFMGKKWDATGIAYNVNLWAEVLRVLKPGGHLCAFGGTRTYHRMTVAIEDAEFEIRDSLHWIYGSGFPKSLDVSKAIDKAAGAERDVIAQHDVGPDMRGGNYENADGRMIANITVPATDAAKQWDGWGTALKPAHEPIVLARKPFTGTVAQNVLQHGTSALNIDATRIGRAEGDISHAGHRTATFGVQDTVSGGDGSGGWQQNDAGRWPANVIIDDTITDDWARYFYCAKPSRTERNAGNIENRHPTVKPLTLMRWLIRLVTPPNGTILDPFAGSGTTLAAATLEHFHAIGIELTEEYIPIIQARCQWAKTQTNQHTPTLFDLDK